MLAYAETKDLIAVLLEKVLSSGANYKTTEPWLQLCDVLEKTNEVKGLILFTDRHYKWHSKTVLIDDDWDREERRIKASTPFSNPKFHYFYHRLGFTGQMYETLYGIPKSLDGLDRLAVLAREYAENLSKTSVDRKIIFYCGPVNATGGFMDLNLNLEHLFRSILKGSVRRVPVFDQTVFESHLVEITKQVKANPSINQAIVLERFYKPLYKNWLVGEMRFLFNWESSGGAQWEMSTSKSQHIPSVILPEGYVDLSFARKTAPQN